MIEIEMNDERKRINTYSRGRAIGIKAGRRLPIVRIMSKDYTSQEDVTLIMEEYRRKCQVGSKNRVLIVGHGHTHAHYSYLPKWGLMLDINPVAVPDLLGNMKDSGFMKRIPEEYFDEIHLMYTPPPSSFHSSNYRIWNNLSRILKKGGMLKSFYVYKVYFLKMKRKTKQEIVEKIKFEGKKWFNRIQVDGSLVIMRK